jgi:DNA replication protein DnaC
VGKGDDQVAPANKACQEGLTAYYARVSRLVNELAIARTDGSYLKLLTKLAK